MYFFLYIFYYIHNFEAYRFGYLMRSSGTTFVRYACDQSLMLNHKNEWFKSRVLIFFPSWWTFSKKKGFFITWSGSQWCPSQGISRTSCWSPYLLSYMHIRFFFESFRCFMMNCNWNTKDFYYLLRFSAMTLSRYTRYFCKFWEPI